MKRFCPNCGNQLQDGERFCSKCGNKLTEEQTSSAMTDQFQQPMRSNDNPAADKQRMTDYTGLRIVLSVICVILVVIGIIFIPGKIKERTSGSEAGTSQNSDQTPISEEGKL